MTTYSQTPLAIAAMLKHIDEFEKQGRLQEEEKAWPSNEIIQHLASQINEHEKFISWMWGAQCDDEESVTEWWID